MTGTEFGFIALRIVGLLMALFALLGAVASVPIMFTDSAPGWESRMLWSGRAYLASQLALLGAGLYLFARARRISGYLFGSAEGRVDQTASEDLQTVAFSLVGLYLAVSALPTVAQLAVQLFWALRGGAELELNRFLVGNRFDLLGGGFEVLVGAWLFLRAQGVSRYWNSLQGKA